MNTRNISNLILQGRHLEAIALLNYKPELYQQVRRESGIGALDNQDMSFTEVAILKANENLLCQMKLLPDQIYDLYDKERITSLKHLLVWDIPMQQTPIFIIVLMSNRTYDQKVQDIRYLLDTGYIPTMLDIRRYYLVMGTDTLYEELVSIPGTIKDVLLGTRYESYRQMMSLLHHSNFYSWRNVYSNETSYDYGDSTNMDTIMGDSVSSIPPTHLIELYENNSRFLLTVHDVLSFRKNPYTNTPIPDDIIRQAKLKREYLWMNGFPIVPVHPDDTIERRECDEIDVLAHHLGKSSTEVTRRMYHLSRLCQARGCTKVRHNISICMYINYLIESGKEDVETISVYMHYLSHNILVLLFG